MLCRKESDFLIFLSLVLLEKKKTEHADIQETPWGEMDQGGKGAE